MKMNPMCYVLVAMAAFACHSACRTASAEPLRSGDQDPRGRLAGVWTRQTVQPEVEGGTPVRRLYELEFMRGDWAATLRTYGNGRFGLRRRLSESFLSYIIDESLMTTRETAVVGNWAMPDKVSLTFMTVTARSRVSLNGDTLTLTRIETTFEKDGVVVKRETSSDVETWKRRE